MPITASEDHSATDIEGTLHVNESRSILVLPINVVDDNTLNLNKILQVEISLQNSEDRNCVILQPNVVDITVMDDDCEFVKI